MLRTLPPSSFIPFDAFRLTNSTIAWKNHAIANKVDFDQYRFCVPHEGDSKEAYAGETRMFLAERYGGRGVGTNGGGVRCGFDGRIQVKGIGRNPLAGEGGDFWHSHGGATLEEAIREAIWGEICNLALPYGGIRVHGIIATGTQTYFKDRNGERMVPRALIMREPSLRPAHYMRAIYFQASQTVLKECCSDLDRAKAAVAKIDSGLAPLVGYPPAKPLDPDFINAGLTEFARRTGCQIATSRIKRIPHGALNCSNVTFSGKYVDYGTMQSISDYGRVIIARGNPELWKEDYYVERSIHNLIFTLTKYLPKEVQEAILAPAVLGESLKSALYAQLSIEFLKLTGIPEWATPNLDPVAMHEFFQCTSDIIRAGNTEPFKMPVVAEEIPETTGLFHLNTIIQTAALCSNAEQMERELRPLLDNEKLRHALITSFSAIRNSYLSAFPEKTKDIAKIFAALNAYRVNQRFCELYRPNLESSINALIAGAPDFESVPSFISTLLAKAQILLADPLQGSLALDVFCKGKINICETAISDEQHRSLSRAELIARLCVDQFSPKTKTMLANL